MDPVQLLTLWIVLLAAGTLLVRVGQTLAAVGHARAKNAASAAARSLADLAATVLAFSLVGVYLLTYGVRSHFIDIDVDAPINFRALTLHFSTMALIASGLIAPAVAGRARWGVPLVGSLLVSLVLFPMLGHWVWYGWLSRAGLIDVAGALPVHLSGALCALVAAYCVGARNGKYNQDGSTSMIPGHQATLPAVGTLLMLVGWIPYVMGSAMLRQADAGSAFVAGAAINALLAAAAGGVGTMAIGRVRFSEDDLNALCGGLLSGAIAMTAAGGAIGPWEAGVLGLVAGLLTPLVAQWLDFKCRIDDPSWVLAPHGVGGIVASLGAAVFLPGSFGAKLQSLGNQCLGNGCIAIATILLSWIVFAAMGRLVGLRVSESSEYDGLDLVEHDVNAYPDFQQTTIKSYHLREA